MPHPVLCPVCQSENHPGDGLTTTCRHCGSALAADTARPGSVDVVIIADSVDGTNADEVTRARARAPAQDATAATRPYAREAATIAMELAQPSASNRLVRIVDPNQDAGGGEHLTGAARPGGAGKFAILEELNRGGMGVVLRGRDRALHREVAIKVIRDQDSPHQRGRFLKEAQITGQLEHPNIVPVHEFGVDAAGRMFFAMKLVRGRNLAEVIDQHRRQPAIAAQEYPLVKMVGILVQVCNAIAFAHSRGVTHRDLKPGNIMLGDFGEVMLMDWGLAKVGEPADGGTRSALGTPRLGDGDSDGKAVASAGAGAGAGASARAAAERMDITVDGAVIGTPAYMSPEQAAGQISKMDQRSDVYALGAVLYEILTLHPPISGSDLKDVLRKAMLGAIEPPERRAPDRAIPKDLAAIAMKALASEPEQRYPAASLMRRDLESFLEGRAVSARADSLVEALGKFIRRHRITSTAVALAALLLAVVLTASYVLNVRQRQRAEAESGAAKRERARAEDAAVAAERERKRATSESQVAQAERARAEQALLVADQQRTIAEEERQRTATALEREQRQREHGDEQNHLAAIALAGEQIGHHEFAAARASLEGCPARYRDWVWRRLSLLCRQQLALFADHRAAVGALACTSDGARLVSAGEDCTLVVYDLQARRRIATVALPPGGIAAVAISRDGARVLSAGHDGSLRLVLVSEGNREGGGDSSLALTGSAGEATCLLLPDGDPATAYSGGRDGSVRAWDLARGCQRRLLGQLGEPVRALALLGAGEPGERVIAGGTAGSVACWDTNDGHLAASARVAGAVLAIEERGPILVYAGARNAAVVWDLAASATLATLDGHERELTCAAFARDGRHLATGSQDGTARVWDLAGGGCPLTLSGHGGTVDALVFTPDSGGLLTAGADGTVRLWDARRRRDIDEFTLTAGLAALSLSPDGGGLVAGGADGAGVLWDLVHARAAATLPHGAEILATAYSRDGALVATAGALGVCRVWDAASGAQRTLIAGPTAAIRQLVFGDDGAVLWTAGDDGAVRAWSTRDGSALYRCPAHSGVVRALALSPDGRTLASAGDDAVIQLCHARSGEALRSIPVQDAAVVALAFAPDGRHLLSASAHGAEIWDAASGEQTQALRGDTGEITRVAYAGDGDQALTASSDGTARIWDVASGRTLLVLREHQQPVAAIQAAPSGRTLITADRSGRVIRWAADEP